jgi:hypothetical protein
MDIGDHHGGLASGFGDEEKKKPRELPDDLPRSLNDRRSVPTDLPMETEMYDAWQGTLMLIDAGVSETLTTVQDNHSSSRLQCLPNLSNSITLALAIRNMVMILP